MKKLIALFALLFAVTIGSAQSADIVIYNKTDCEMYVRLHLVNVNCHVHVVTFDVHPNTAITHTPIAGYWVEAASVSDSNPPNPSPSCFNERVMVPWANCLFGFNASETDNSCNGCGVITASWTASPSDPGAPVLTIFN